LVEDARKDLAALQAAGFDAVMFGNENDRPYEFKVDTASTATVRPPLIQVILMFLPSADFPVETACNGEGIADSVLDGAQ
jgi:BtpA family